MDAIFWHQRWGANDIPFHERAANPLLVKYFQALSLGEGGRVFLPLCGKTLDIGWLLSNGYDVAGAELSEIAVRQLFIELGMANQKYQKSKHSSTIAQTISIYSSVISFTCPARHLVQLTQFMSGQR